jgi:hypothetical protein
MYQFLIMKYLTLIMILIEEFHWNSIPLEYDMFVEKRFRIMR